MLILYWPIMFVATHLSPPQLRRLEFQGNDKVLHFLAFFALTLAFWLAFSGFKSPDLRSRRPYLVALMMLCYGAFDEISQRFVERSMSVWDWTADALGIFTALFLLFALRRCLYWLILFWLAFALFRHWPGAEPLVSFLPGHFARYSVAYLMVVYIVLTLLWTRSISPVPMWILDRKTVALTVVCLPAYVVFDVWLKSQATGVFSAADMFGGFMGIIFGLMLVVVFS